MIGPRTIANTNISKDLDLDPLMYEYSLPPPHMYIARHFGHHFATYLLRINKMSTLYFYSMFVARDPTVLHVTT